MSRAADDEPSAVPATWRLNKPFTGISTFLRAPYIETFTDLDADIAVFGVPFDEGSPYLAGSRMGPRAIREHSLRFAGGDNNGIYDPTTRRTYLQHELTQRRIVDVGDADIWPTAVEHSFDNASALTRSVLAAGALPVMIGGDHSVTYPVVRGFDNVEPVHVIHFDAHLDYAPFVHDLRFTNMHPFRHIAPMAHVQSLTQVGIRSLRTAVEEHEDSLADGNKVVTMRDFLENGPQSVADSVPKDARVYVSIDIDVLDLPLIPGCVSAEPDGMSYGQLRDTLQAIAQHADVVGLDLVEVNPPMDIATGVTSYLAAHTVIEFLGFICMQPRWIARHPR